MDYSLLLAGLVYSLISSNNPYDTPVKIQNIINTSDEHIRCEVWEPDHSFGPTDAYTIKPYGNYACQKLLKLKKTKIKIWRMKEDGSYDRCLFTYMPSGQINELFILISKDDDEDTIIMYVLDSFFNHTQSEAVSVL